jgi:hypothetical protein
VVEAPPQGEVLAPRWLEEPNAGAGVVVGVVVEVDPRPDIPVCDEKGVEGGCEGAELSKEAKPGYGVPFLIESV